MKIPRFRDSSRSVVGSALLLLLGATQTVAGEEVWPVPQWSVSTPAEQELDPAPLAELVRLIEESERFPELHSLLLIRNGLLVVEQYFGRFDRATEHTLQSVSKSFTSAAVGIAIEKGVIKDVDEPVLGFFPEQEEIDNLDDRKRAIRLEDLLTMRSGTDYHERGSDSPHFQLNRLSKGWTRFILDRPMVCDPGSRFNYDSGAVILTSSLIEARTGEHADDYLEEHLFEPMGIERVRWYRNDEGHPHTGGGLYLRPRDMARFGLLYLRGGRWQDKQLVPRAWVDKSVRRHVEFGEKRRHFKGYGYWWWILPPAEGDQQDIYSACGYMGQYIIVVPEHDLVVVVTGGARKSVDQNRPLEFLYSHVLAAVKR